MIYCKRDALEALRPWDGRENAWMLVGKSEGRHTARITRLIEAGPGSDLDAAKAASIRFDPDAVAGDEVLGLVHTHPPGHPLPSEADLRADLAWMPLLGLPFGVFGILCETLRWFVLARDARHYVPADAQDF